MLLTSHISNFPHGSDEWFAARSARFTSSENHLLTGKKIWTEGALSYIYRKVGESISGIPIRKEIETEATAWGNIYEVEGIRKFGRIKGLQFVTTQILIFDPNGCYSSTPDFLIQESEAKDEKGNPGWNVITGEVKCPLTYEAYIALALCKTPLELKEQEPKYYWQVIDQMLVCGTGKGIFVLYHPFFGDPYYIEFKMSYKDAEGKYPLLADMKLLKERKELAVKEFEIVKAKLLNRAA